MTTAGQPSGARTGAYSPASFLAAASALAAMDDALRAARHQTPDVAGPGPEQAAAFPMLPRQVRERLAGWETRVIEAARDAGAGCQAAERRYVCGRLGTTGTTSGQRVAATRRARAAERANAADLRRLTGQVTALAPLGPEARVSAPPTPPGSLRP